MPTSAKKSKSRDDLKKKDKVLKDSDEYKQIKHFIQDKFKRNQDIKDIPKQGEVHDTLFGADSRFDHRSVSNLIKSIKKKIDNGTLSDSEWSCISYLEHRAYSCTKITRKITDHPSFPF